MNRRSFIRGMGASLALASLPSCTQGQQRREDATPTTNEPLSDYMWEFINFGARPNQYIVVERFWLGSPVEARKAVFSNEPLESVTSPIENATRAHIREFGYAHVRFGNLWGEDIEVAQIHVPVGEYVWIVTVDETVALDTAAMVVESTREFDEPRAPRGWTKNRAKPIS